MKEMLIAVDIDNTVYPLMQEWIELYNQRTNHKLKLDDITMWGVHNIMTGMPRTMVYDLLDDVEYYRDPLPDCVDVISELISNNHRIIFHSNILKPMHAEKKLAWLVRHFSHLEWDVVFGKGHERKLNYVEKADIIIDDSPVCADFVLLNYLKAQMIVIKWPWNSALKIHPNLHFVDNWKYLRAVCTILGAL